MVRVPHAKNLTRAGEIFEAIEEALWPYHAAQKPRNISDLRLSAEYGPQGTHFRFFARRLDEAVLSIVLSLAKRFDLKVDVAPNGEREEVCVTLSVP